MGAKASSPREKTMLLGRTGAVQRQSMPAGVLCVVFKLHKQIGCHRIYSYVGTSWENPAQIRAAWEGLNCLSRIDLALRQSRHTVNLTD